MVGAGSWDQELAAARRRADKPQLNVVLRRMKPNIFRKKDQHIRVSEEVGKVIPSISQMLHMHRERCF